MPRVFFASDSRPTIIRTRMHSDQFVTAAIDPRSGRISLRDPGSVTSAAGDLKLLNGVKAANDNASNLSDLLLRLKQMVSAPGLAYIKTKSACSRAA